MCKRFSCDIELFVLRCQQRHKVLKLELFFALFKSESKLPVAAVIIDL